MQVLTMVWDVLVYKMKCKTHKDLLKNSKWNVK
jgi:hypothetical protein